MRNKFSKVSKIIKKLKIGWLGLVIPFLILTGGLLGQVQAAISASERTALIALYDSTNGDEWFDNSGWKAPPLHEDGFALPGTEFSWYGMDCSFPNTIQIRLVINNLNGSIPAEIGNLTSLINLRLMNNRELTGIIPPEIGNLANLQILNLIGNQLTGTIPVELSNLADLGTLALWSNQFTGTIPAELSKLSKLGYLGLDGNQFTGNIPAWGTISCRTKLCARDLLRNLPNMPVFQS